MKGQRPPCPSFYSQKDRGLLRIYKHTHHTFTSTHANAQANSRDCVAAKFLVHSAPPGVAYDHCRAPEATRAAVYPRSKGPPLFAPSSKSTREIPDTRRSMESSVASPAIGVPIPSAPLAPAP
eukprot:GHVU01132349.1.p4 GENE.GHVU01132349.1~~GHVU01132349.1.p4  ORF type:complete len:123 (+),score=1.47 GHVU01132349.1:1464-1832(+)